MNSQKISYNFEVPPTAIAKKPATPRDAAKLLIYDTATDTLTIDKFLNIDVYLPTKSFLVLNQTKVLPARLTITKETGGKVTLLLLLNEIQSKDTTIKALIDRKVVVGQKLHIDKKHHLIATKQHENMFVFKPNFKLHELPKILQRLGATPIPPYIRDTSLNEKALRERYQTIFAQKSSRPTASVAAPTASLHFTDKVFQKLSKQKITNHRVTLHVGLGTFAPLTEQNFKTKKLFPEYYEISAAEAAAINRDKQDGKKLIAVGTTACRAIESAAIKKSKGYVLKSGSSKTQLFVYPPHQFKMIDGLITNFHLPQSSLMFLVDALLQSKHAKRSITEIYTFALKHDFRFYSFGDAMLIY